MMAFAAAGISLASACTFSSVNGSSKSIHPAARNDPGQQSFVSGDASALDHAAAVACSGLGDAVLCEDFIEICTELCGVRYL